MPISTKTKLYAAAAIILASAIAIGAWRDRVPTAVDVVYQNTRAFLAKALFQVGEYPVRIFFLIKVLLFLIFLSLVARIARHVLTVVLRDSSRIDQHRGYLLSKFVTWAIYGIGILIGIHIEGIDLTTLAIVTGSLGIGVGFGLQTLVSNFVAGLILLIEQPIRLGDRIEFGDRTGEVVRVGSRSTSVRTYDNAILIVPNSDLIAKPILNWTASDPKIRVAVPVSVANTSDPDEVMRNLLELADSNGDVMKNPASVVLLSEVGPHSLTFTLRVWTLTKADNFAQLRSDLYRSILKRFKERNIEMPFPQLDLHVKSIEAPVSINVAK